MIIIGTPYLIWPLIKNHVNAESAEKRELAACPTLELSKESLDAFPAAFETYINDHMPLRNQLIMTNSALNYHVFATSSNEDVLVGKDGWLFYVKKSDGNPLANYLGKNLLSEAQLRTIADNVIKTQENLAKEGTEFIIMVNPNKEHVYPEYMPDIYDTPADMYITKQIVDYLKANTDVTVVYTLDSLLAAKEALGDDTLLYRKTDSHWNRLGTYIATAELMKETGVSLPDYDSSEVSIVKTDDIPGDLSDMLGLGNLVDPGSLWEVTGYDEHNYKITEADEKPYTTGTATGACPKKILIRRDSFGEHMKEIIAASYNESVLVHQLVFDNEVIKREKPDIFVYEVVERNLTSLLNYVYE